MDGVDGDIKTHTHTIHTHTHITHTHIYACVYVRTRNLCNVAQLMWLGADRVIICVPGPTHRGQQGGGISFGTGGGADPFGPGKPGVVVTIVAAGSGGGEKCDGGSNNVVTRMTVIDIVGVATIMVAGGAVVVRR